MLMRLVVAAVFVLCLPLAFWELAASPSHPEPSTSIYDPNPSHIWNRLYAALLIREDRHGTQFGADSLDPLLWPETEQLLAAPSHERALRVLDEFLQTHAENLIHDPTKRAMLQHDLWSVFDWSVQQFPGKDRPQYNQEKQELQIRLAEVLRRLALTPDQVNALPNNYAKAVAAGAYAKEFDPAHPDIPFLPPDLFDPHGPWVCIQPSPDSDSGVARMHTWNVSGRSGFFVFVRLPEGRKATMNYFQTLWNFPEPWVAGPSSAADQTRENPDLPSFPAGTQVALVRRMTLFDNQGQLAASTLTESVQIRVYRAITAAEERNFGNGNLDDITRNSGQLFFEFKLSRSLLFSGTKGGLRAITPEDKEFSTFQTNGDDPFEEKGGRPDLDGEPANDLQTCVWCHNGGGVRSLNSRNALLKPNRLQQEPQNPDYGPIYWGDSAAETWKQNHYDWGLLNGYWKASSPR
jgi:hypothetical protein